MIVVLEDDSRRSNAMRTAYYDSDIELPIKFFDDANVLCNWLRENIRYIATISLDHDLDLIAANVSSDVGTGADVVSWMIETNLKIPVVIHSSNAMRAPGMHMDLALAGWNNVLLAPFSSASNWISDIKRALQGEGAA